MTDEGKAMFEHYLQQFLEGEKRSVYIYTPEVELYVRRAYRCILERGMVTLDLANIHVEHPRQGTFTFVLATMQRMCPWNAVYVESVMSDIIHDVIMRAREKDVRWVRVGERIGYGESFAWVKDRIGVYASRGSVNNDLRGDDHHSESLHHRGGGIGLRR
jgi:hypothetical protein